MKGRRILLFIATILAALTCLSMVFPRNGVSVGSLELHYPSFKSVVTPVKNQSVEEMLVDSAMLRALDGLVDSADYYRYLLDSSDLRFWLPSPDYFNPFWNAAERAQSDTRPLRILHYGDSQIEMDHITSRLRAYMQHRFGGGGPGMLPFRVITPNPSVSQSTSGDLIHITSFGDSLGVRSRNDYGVMMQCFRSSGEATLSLRPTRYSSADKRLRSFSHFTLIFNNRGQNLSATLSDRKSNYSSSLSASQSGVGSLSWQLDTTASNIRLRVSGAADLYCVLVDNGPGIAVDNIPMRGCSGQQFTLVSQPMLSAAYSQMNVGLVILQFGGNSVPYFHSAKRISDYCTSIGRQIDHIHACCPNARILFIGPSDMSKNINGQYQTYPIIPQLIDSLAHTAVSHGAAFWSIYHAMGGRNSMPQWARQGLAGHDYIHFSQRGADLMGDRLAQAFDNSYRYYKLQHQIKNHRNKPGLRTAPQGRKKHKGGRQ